MPALERLFDAHILIELNVIRNQPIVIHQGRCIRIGHVEAPVGKSFASFSKEALAYLLC
jgi:hypothetical protein